MDDNLDGLISRRSFLRQGSCASLGLVGLTSQIFAMRAMAGALDRAAFNDYRAIVCVFLFGGNDSGNTLIPWDNGEQNYDVYAQERTTLAIAPADLEPHVIAPVNTGGRRFAIHPSLSGVRQLFEQGNAAMVANVGTLLFPLTRDEYRSGVVPAPAQLYGHNTQQEQWQLTRPDGQDGVGWGGRIADMLQANGANADATVSMNISIAGQSRFLSGRNVSGYAVGTGGPQSLSIGNTSNNTLARQSFLDMLAVQEDPTHPARHAMRKVIRDVTRRSIESGEIINTLLANGTQVTVPVPADNSLASQLAMVARLIEFGQAGLGHSRQIFFVSAGGFDNHDGLLGDLPTTGPHGTRLKLVNDALVYFWDALGQLNMRNRVTTFTASDFGRTFRSNGNGSDHGWGGHHIVMGGSQLRGRRLFGAFPNILRGGPDDATNTAGNFIPTTSVEAYGFEMARWMGVPASEMSTIFPNLSRFLDVNNPSTQLRMLL